MEPQNPQQEKTTKTCGLVVDLKAPPASALRPPQVADHRGCGGVPNRRLADAESSGVLIPEEACPNLGRSAWCPSLPVLYSKLSTGGPRIKKGGVDPSKNGMKPQNQPGLYSFGVNIHAPKWRLVGCFGQVYLVVENNIPLRPSICPKRTPIVMPATVARKRGAS